MLFLIKYIFCLRYFLKHHLCHFNDHAVTGCRNDVPTKARILTSFSFFPPRLVCLYSSIHDI